MKTCSKLKQRRKELNLTMLDVAKKTGVSEATVSRWESGDIANMRRDRIVLLANALQVPPSFIMGDDEAIAEAPIAQDDRLNILYELTKELNDNELLALKSFVAGLKANRKQD